MPKPFLLEIATEPLPARLVGAALGQLAVKAEALLKEERLDFASLRALGTHRRLSLLVSGLAEASAPVEKWELGPPAAMLKDGSGAFTPQAEGFARKWKVEVSALQTREGPKGAVLAAPVRVSPESALKVLPRVIPRLLSSLQFEKSMFWDDSGMRFSRPVRAIAAVLGKRALSLRLGGVKAGSRVQGSWQWASKPFVLADAGRYAESLRTRLVLVDPYERLESLRKGLEREAQRLGTELVEDGLLKETLFLAETPHVLSGSFDPKYLELPEDLVLAVLTGQMKCFPLRRGRSLFPGFLIVRDGASEGTALVRSGYERVLKARLEDAAFFFAIDKKTPLDSRRAGLEGLGYHKNLGSMLEKAGRVRDLAEWLRQNARAPEAVNWSAALRIAELGYADLVTEVVREFPELQGSMGAVYALREGLDSLVSEGLGQFYWPVAAGSPLPRTIEAAMASLAEKIETVAMGFVGGLAPTASADPYALRRKALGAIRIIAERKIDLDLREALRWLLHRGARPSESDARLELDRLASEILEFFWGRIESLWQEKEYGYPVDEIRAVKSFALQNPHRAWLRLRAVHDARKQPDFEAIAVSFKRAANILRQAGETGEGKREKGNDPRPSPVSALPSRESGLPQEEAEAAFQESLLSLEHEVEPLIREARFEEALASLVRVRPSLDLFFEKVLVMAEDPMLRERRLGLLSRLVRLFGQVGDLSQLQPK